MDQDWVAQALKVEVSICHNENVIFAGKPKSQK